MLRAARIGVGTTALEIHLQPYTEGLLSLLGFAEDTMVIARGRFCHEVEAILNYALSVVSIEIAALGLSLATEKNEAVVFKRKYIDTVPRLFLNNTQVPMERCIKYLGI